MSGITKRKPRANERVEEEKKQTENSNEFNDLSKQLYYDWLCEESDTYHMVKMTCNAQHKFVINCKWSALGLKQNTTPNKKERNKKN